jgi:NitT/TauT family transport system ATP-binding protein
MTIPMTETTPVGRATEEFAIDGVSHTFPGSETPAISGIDLRIARGEIVALIGPSGCGKSTLLNMLAGLLQPSDGSVSLRGHRMDGPDPRVGVMFQKAALLPWRTAIENVLLPIEVRDGRRQARQARDKAHALLETVGLGGFGNAYPWQLSGGMAQRAAICRMLITEPEVLLLDEPFGALDEFTRERMDLEVQRVAASRGATVVLVTHSIPEAVFLADRVVAMAARPGRVSEVVDVPIERPRTYETMSDPVFTAGVNRVRRALDRGHHE